MRVGLAFRAGVVALLAFVSSYLVERIRLLEGEDYNGVVGVPDPKTTSVVGITLHNLN